MKNGASIFRHHGLFCHGAKPANMASLVLVLLMPQARAEFSLNFQPNPNVVSSIANQTCNSGGGGGMMGGMMGGGMMGFGPGCDSTIFRQEVINDNGTQYYHVIVQDAHQDFSQEFYMRTGGCCWFSGGGMMGGMMGGGGDAPYSSSYGNVNDRLANAWQPLAGPATSGNGTGNPGRIYMAQINNDAQMQLSFIKSREAMKPRISQNISNGTLRSNFDLDMSNGGYTSFTNPARLSNTLTLGQAGGLGNFNMATDAPRANVTAGRFRYTPGTVDGGSNGTFTYEAGGFNVANVNWLSYCEPPQNDHNCNFGSGGGMMGGMMGGGMMGM